jgi:ribonuclease G
MEMNGMKRQILISRQEEQYHIALLEDGDLVEYHIEDSSEDYISGNVYLGRTDDVLPGLSCAFIDIGVERNGFLHASDAVAISPEDEFDQMVLSQAQGIEEIAKKGKPILVQVAKDPIADKGAKLTTNITLPGRFAVLIPSFDRIGVSHRIEDEQERGRLHKIAELVRPVGMGLIIRTVSVGKSEDEIRQDVEKLAELWDEILQQSQHAHSPSLIYKNPGKIINILRDIVNYDVSKIITDDESVMNRVKCYLDEFAPSLVDRIELYDNSQPIFTHFGVEKELEKMLGRKVWLRSGGYIVIDQTEALTAIDVNTGKFVGKRDPEDTILKTNLDAAKEIAKQVRLRDIGGVIVIDFIDMRKQDHREKVIASLTEATSHDRSRVKILELSELGLVEMTRKRVQEAVTSSMFRKCPYCHGEGQVLTDSTIFLKIEREIQQILTSTGKRTITISLHPDLKGEAEERLMPKLRVLSEQHGGKFKLRYSAQLTLDGIEIATK